MSELREGCVYVVSVDEEESESIKKQCHDALVNKATGPEYIVLGGPNQGSVLGTEHLVHLLRKYSLHDNDRQTILSQEDSLNLVQLCLAEQNRKLIGSFEVEASKVLSVMQQLTEQKLRISESVLDDEVQVILDDYNASLQSTNTIDLIDVLNKVKEEKANNEALKNELKSTSYVIYKLPTTQIEREILMFLVDGHRVQLALVEVPLNSSQDCQDPEGTSVNIVYESVNHIKDAMARLPAQSRPKISVTEAYAQKVIMSYLELLVNSRNEMALARIIDVPSRGLGHKAFTDLKHVAQPKGMSMYQTAVSHVMRIRLGGKSYAPGTDNPLVQHTKGLSELVDLIHKLQSIVEEEPDSSKALRRVLNVIKNSIVNNRDNTLRKQSIEAVVAMIQTRAENTFNFIQTKTKQTPPKSVGQGGSMLGRLTLKVIRYLLDAYISLTPEGNVVDHLSDMFSSQHTPVRFPSLLSQFRSPVEASPECISNKTLAERVSNRMKPKTKVKQIVPRFQSCMDWAMPVHDSSFNKGETFVIEDFIPSKTIAHPAENTFQPKVRGRTAPESRMDQENLDILASLSDTTGESSKVNSGKSNKDRPGTTKSAKRPLQSADVSESQAKKSKKSSAPKKTKSKGPTLSKGQTQLTAFFRI